MRDIGFAGAAGPRNKLSLSPSLPLSLSLSLSPLSPLSPLSLGSREAGGKLFGPCDGAAGPSRSGVKAAGSGHHGPARAAGPGRAGCGRRVQLLLQSRHAGVLPYYGGRRDRRDASESTV